MMARLRLASVKAFDMEDAADAKNYQWKSLFTQPVLGALSVVRVKILSARIQA